MNKQYLTYFQAVDACINVNAVGAEDAEHDNVYKIEIVYGERREERIRRSMAVP